MTDEALTRINHKLAITTYRGSFNTRTVGEET
jgi:hypothetical protein